MLQRFRQVIRGKLLEQKGSNTLHDEENQPNNTNELDWNESSISESPDSNDISKDAELIPVMSPKSKQTQTKVSTFFMKKNFPNEEFNKIVVGNKKTENNIKTIDSNNTFNKQSTNYNGDSASSISKTSPSKKPSNSNKTFSFLSQMVRSPSQISFQIDSDLARVINVLNKSNNKRTIRDCELVGSAIKKTNFFKEYECVLNDPLKLTQLAQKLKYTYYNPYQALILEGESSRKMFILMKGSVWMLVKRREGYEEIENRVKELVEQAEKRGEKEPTCYVDADDYVQFKHKELKILSTISSPDVIGDTELLHKTNRCISIVTKTTVHLATIDYYDFNEIFMPQTDEQGGQQNQQQQQLYSIVSGKNTKQQDNLSNKVNTQESIFPIDKTLILFEQNQLFQAFSRSLLHIILRYSQTQNLCRSQIIYNQEDNAEYVYFIEEGEVELKQKQKYIHGNDADTPRKLIEQIERDQKQELLRASCKHRHKDNLTKNESERYVAVLGPGEVFGEDFLKGEGQRLHTAVCKSVKLKVYKIQVSMLKELLLSKDIDLSSLDIKSQWREQLKSTARVIEKTFENPTPNEVEFKMMKQAADQFLLANPYSIETNLNNTFNIPSEINSFMKINQEKYEKNIVKSVSQRYLNTTGCLEEKQSQLKEGGNNNNNNNNSMGILNSARSLAFKSAKKKDIKYNNITTDINPQSSTSFLPISSESNRQQFLATTGQLSLDVNRKSHTKNDFIKEIPHGSRSSSFLGKQSKLIYDNNTANLSSHRVPSFQEKYFFECQSARHQDYPISPIKQHLIAEKPTINNSAGKLQLLNESQNSGNSSIAVISPAKTTGYLPMQQRRSSQNYFFPEKHNPNDTFHLKTLGISNCSTSRQISSRQYDGTTEIQKNSSQYHAYFPDLRRLSTPITSFDRLSELVPNKSSNFKNKQENGNITTSSSEQTINRVPQIQLETLIRRKSKNLGINHSFSNGLNRKLSETALQKTSPSLEKKNKDNIVPTYGYNDTIGGVEKERILIKNESYLKELSRKLKDVKTSRKPPKKNTHFNPFKLNNIDDNSNNTPTGNSTSWNTISSRVQVFRQLNIDTIFPDSAYGIEAKQGLARINTLLEQTHEQELEDRNVERLRKKLPAMINDQISAEDAKQTVAQQQQLFNNSKQKLKGQNTLKINKSEKDLIDGLNGNTDSKVYIKLLLGKIQKEDKLNSDYNFIGKKNEFLEGSDGKLKGNRSQCAEGRQHEGKDQDQLIYQNQQNGYLRGNIICQNDSEEEDNNNDERMNMFVMNDQHNLN